MTKNQIESERNKETERHNRRSEQLEGIQTAFKPFDTLVKGASSFAKVLGKENDKSWYNKDAALVTNAGNVSYQAALGTETPVAVLQVKAGSGEVGDTRAIGGGMILPFSITIGKSGIDSPINLAAKDMYAVVRRVNSGATNYQPSDVIKIVVAVDSALTYYSHLSLVYSLMNTTKAENKYYLSSYIKALGYNYNDLELNLSDFRLYINRYARKLNIIKIPKDIPVLWRHVWLAGSIFKDQPVKKSQEYIFRPRCLQRYDDSKGTLVVINTMPEYDGSATSIPNLSFKDIKSIGDALLSGLIYDDDVATIVGDILHAFSNDQVLTIDNISEDYHIESIWSEEVLAQIGSAKVFSLANESSLAIKSLNNGVIYQGDAIVPDDGEIAQYAITFKPWSLTWGGYYIDKQWPINMYKDDATPDDTMVTSRLSALVGICHRVSAPDDKMTYIKACGSEIIETYIAVRRIDNAMRLYTGYDLSNFSFAGVTTQESLQDAFNSITAVLEGDWSPRIRVICSIKAGAENTGLYPLFDSMEYANYTWVDATVLQNLHEVALLSLYSAVYFTGRGGAVTKGSGKPSKR